MKTRRTLIGLAVLIAAFVAVLVIFDSKPKPPPEAGCPDAVFMYFRDDDTMRSTARILRGDLRVRNLTEKTKQQMMDAYNQLGEDRMPRALRRYDVTRMPPAVVFNVSSGYNRTDVKEQLQKSYQGEAAVIDCLDIAALDIGQPV